MTSTEGPMVPIVHAAFASEWAAAQAAGAYTGSTRGRTLAEEGFIHASTPAQLGPVLATFYTDVPAGDLVLLVLDSDRLEAAGSPVRWEPPPGTTEEFPHIYGPIPVAAVVATLPLTRDVDDDWMVPEL